MSIPYQESYGEDDYEEITGYWADISDTGCEVTVYRRNTWYNRETRLWECGCNVYQVTSRCKHVYRSRPEETIMVREEYL